jgi:ADP-heptose:LPS heptosyltransferase
LEAFKRDRPDCELTVGTSLVWESVVRTIPSVDRIIPDYRVRYLRFNRSGVQIYKNRKTGYFDGPFDLWYSLDHPYKNCSYQEQQNLHIIDLAARILGVSGYNRRGSIFLQPANEEFGIHFSKLNPEGYVLLAPFSSKRSKQVSEEIIRTVSRMFKRVYYLAPTESHVLSDIQATQLVIPNVLDAAAVISRCSYFVGLDSGLSHVAAAANVPMTTLHKGYSVGRCGVLSDNAQVIDMNQRIDLATVIDRIREHSKALLVPE